MIDSNYNFCFSTLALGEKYRGLARELIGDLEKYCPAVSLYIYTDDPQSFSGKYGIKIFGFKHRKKGILHCYHDKRFVIEKALVDFATVIHIDADSRIVNPVEAIAFPPGITGNHENLIEHVTRNNPQQLKYMQQLADKLDLDLEKVDWIGESAFVVRRDFGKEIEFVKTWGEIGTYLELHGIHSGSGNAIGLAAAKVGWQVNRDENWQKLTQAIQNLDTSRKNSSPPLFENFKQRLDYYYRLNATRLTAAIEDFDFYYGSNTNDSE
ncbi:hypothetical protein JJD41_08085 [Oxynema sp. CENA135]|uniref:hypothetical protein n=1 Tax=Oxynema sp. CENA135 TaxID=984206 RepID=UPI00190DDAE5|nr:hypothetical protein [Oxynema sp. CENA135]MBK4729823.1 hypothetical protein [Oxynema sp. CENA135]